MSRDEIGLIILQMGIALGFFYLFIVMGAFESIYGVIPLCICVGLIALSLKKIIKTPSKTNIPRKPYGGGGG